MEKLKQILTSKKAKTFYWTTVNSLIVLILTMIGSGEITIGDAMVSAVLVAGLNFTTKYINQTYLTESDTTL